MSDESRPASSSHDDVDMTQDPPSTMGGIVRRLGPGLIIAGSIVGSGELIATTKTGAIAGISLLWLIVIGCVIKIFAQIELGRYTISTGQTTLTALNSVPGPRRLGVNWIVWFWLLMMLGGLGQLGGIIGGVGQALALAMPITRDDDNLGDYQRAIQVPSESEFKRHIKWTDDKAAGGVEFAKLSKDRQRRINNGLKYLNDRFASSERLQIRSQEAIAVVRALMVAEKELKSLKAPDGAAEDDRAEENPAVKAAEKVVDEKKAQVNALLEPRTWDDKIWAALVAVFTILLLYRGKYSVVQNVATVLVVGFTFVTIGNVIALQSKPVFALTMSDLMRGFGLPEAVEGKNPIGVALATFGIIGVGASELVAYPYWCLEKGYARFTGPCSEDESWAVRARGWMRVMYCDAFLSMLVYTVATLAFFIMGVAVLHEQGLDPDGMRMVSTLLQQYVPVFGPNAKWLFLFGAVAVLYSTFMVATAGNSRMLTDALKIYGLMRTDSEAAHRRSISIFCVVLPLICLGLFCTGLNPVTMVLLGGFMQALLLPMLGFAALYFRFVKTDRRILPGKAWDVCLVLSGVGLLIAGAWGLYDKILSKALAWIM